jgi:hypothetical protein
MKLRGILNDVRTFFMTVKRYERLPTFGKAAALTAPATEALVHGPMIPPDALQEPTVGY